jgi:predicted nucleotidyltransferase
MDSRPIELPEHHQEIIDRFIAACQSDDRILAAFLGGSYANGSADKFSDLDLFFISTDQAYQEFIIEREAFIRQLDIPLFLDDFGAGHGYCVIFSNGTEADIWFGRESKFKDIYAGPFKVLLDKTGIISGEDFPQHVADQADQRKNLQRQIDWFWHDLSHFIKAIGRRQLWFALGELEVLRQICVNLARMKYNFTDTFDAGEPYFKIESTLPVEQLSPLKDSFCVMQYDAVLQAALVLCRYYQDVAPQLAKEHGVTYQAGLERMLIQQLEDLVPI